MDRNGHKTYVRREVEYVGNLFNQNPYIICSNNMKWLKSSRSSNLGSLSNSSIKCCGNTNWKPY